MPQISSRSRNGLIRKIHVARRQLGLDEDAYRELLGQATGMNSLRAMNERDLLAVVRAFYSKGWGEGQRSSKDKHGLPKNFFPAPDGRGTAKLMTKIEALLAEMGTAENGFVPWSYAAAILKRMYRVDRLEWATPEQLRGVIAALANGGGRRKGGQIALDQNGKAYRRTWHGNSRGWVWDPVEE